jgi:hypothetical protein
VKGCRIFDTVIALIAGATLEEQHSGKSSQVMGASFVR